jgi:hypothetical protein
MTDRKKNREKNVKQDLLVKYLVNVHKTPFDDPSIAFYNKFKNVFGLLSKMAARIKTLLNEISSLNIE